MRFTQVPSRSLQWVMFLNWGSDWGRQLVWCAVTRCHWHTICFFQSWKVNRRTFPWCRPSTRRMPKRWTRRRGWPSAEGSQFYFSCSLSGTSFSESPVTVQDGYAFYISKWNVKWWTVVENYFYCHIFLPLFKYHKCYYSSCHKIAARDVIDFLSV